MTLSTLRLGNGWNKARVGSNRFTAQKSDACPKSLDVRFIRVASHAKDVIKHVWTRALMCPGRFASVHACWCVIAFSGRTSCYWWLDIVLREFGRIAGSQAAHRLRLQTVQARRPGLVRKCLHSLDFSFAESFKQSGGCVRKNQHPMVRFFGLYSIELNKIASPCWDDSRWMQWKAISAQHFFIVVCAFSKDSMKQTTWCALLIQISPTAGLAAMRTSTTSFGRVTRLKISSTRHSL